MKRPIVLIVDDNEDNREAYTAALEHYGYSVATAINGLEGVERARDLLPDVILMDISMPVLDGFGATRLIRRCEETKSIPVIAITAHDDSDTQSRAAEVGMDAFVTKPCHPRRVIEQVAWHLGSPRADASESGRHGGGRFPAPFRSRMETDARERRPI